MKINIINSMGGTTSWTLNVKGTVEYGKYEILS